MPSRRETKRRLPAPRLSYSTKVHLKRRLASIDYRFVGAVAALAAATFGIVRYL